MKLVVATYQKKNEVSGSYDCNIEHYNPGELDSRLNQLWGLSNYLL
jgi:hypothetical protein